MRLFCLCQAAPPWFYNQTMRSVLFLGLYLSAASLCWAQSAAPAAQASAPPVAAGAGVTAAVEKRAERIRVEDSAARIDELRVGGETQSISVQPKGGLPAYQIAPDSGQRSWKILSF